ncbi:hypothetical protein BT96DRAFT_919369 [Gymnopus androsaceus JB14]|uniref:Uncharacterized protein n=1 Tax=Gymnopus androsaceus JB14 TaxID=1447944 RepID=A0A6A4HRY7_9AGAR|nr:hypothetical protein BT96DRAFT_929202 [Gymnopus androsaceus JB14]KAE9400510.1 hypothetical protein BT96DRAFT_919369 [Gymnopus androsaceus JB14]
MSTPGFAVAIEYGLEYTDNTEDIPSTCGTHDFINSFFAIYELANSFESELGKTLSVKVEI